MSKSNEKENSPPNNFRKALEERRQQYVKSVIMSEDLYRNKDPDDMIIARILSLINAFNLSHNQFAAKINYSEGYLSNIINKKVPISPNFVKKLVMNTGVKYEWLLKGEGDMLIKDHPSLETKVSAITNDVHFEDTMFLEKLFSHSFEERLIFYKFFD